MLTLRLVDKRTKVPKYHFTRVKPCILSKILKSKSDPDPKLIRSCSDPEPDPDQNDHENQDPDPNKVCSDPQHWY